MKNKLNILIISLLISLNVNSQQKHTIDTMPVQIGVVTPLGTNGMQSWYTVNKFSLNMFAGYSAGVDGFEGSGFASIVSGDMHGAQISGFVNATLGKTDGAQFAGFVNTSYKEVIGAQFAGFVNANINNTKAFQGAGFTNVVLGEMEGAQFAGFTNFALKTTNGVQFSGFANTVVDSIDGLQGAGFVNYSMGNSMGQISGFANANIGDCNGIQATGFVNVNTGRVKGAQIAGFINATRILNGVQIGFINVCDSLEKGMPIGFLSVVRNGYHVMELKTSETFYGIASFKTGTRQFYNIFSTGAAVRNTEILWGWGYGVGTIVDISEKTSMAIELEAFHINQDEWHTKQLNLLNKLTLQASYKINPSLELFGGPTFNVVVSDIEDNKGEAFKSNIAPYNVFSKVYNNKTRVEMYPGITAGIRF